MCAEGDQWIMVDDERLPLLPGETPEMIRCRFRTLGCYVLTGVSRGILRDDISRNHRGNADYPPFRAGRTPD